MKNSTRIAIAVWAFIPFNALVTAQATVDPSGTWQREYDFGSTTGQAEFSAQRNPG